MHLICFDKFSGQFIAKRIYQIFMSTIPSEDQLAQLVQFRLDLYALFSNSRDSLMDLLDALYSYYSQRQFLDALSVQSNESVNNKST